MIPNGNIIWEGASLINGAPIILLVTGTTRPSSNRKTGWMLQTWILPKDFHPTYAIRSGADESVCGSCSMRGDNGKGRVCYVNQMTLGQVYKAYREEKYPLIKAIHRLNGRDLRIASYGEATALPFEVWEPLLKVTRVKTGYTHRWKVCDTRWKQYIQASVESVQLKTEANSQGWKTFRVKLSHEPVLPDEIYCPADSSNYAITCQDCGKCNGRSGNIVVNVHGMGARNFRA